MLLPGNVWAEEAAKSSIRGRALRFLRCSSAKYWIVEVEFRLCTEILVASCCFLLYLVCRVQVNKSGYLCKVGFVRLFRVFLHRIQHCIQDELQGVLKDIGLAFDDGSVQGMLQRTDSTLFGFHLYIVGDDDGGGGGGGAGGGSCLYGNRKLKGEANCGNS